MRGDTKTMIAIFTFFVVLIAVALYMENFEEEVEKAGFTYDEVLYDHAVEMTYVMDEVYSFTMIEAVSDGDHTTYEEVEYKASEGRKFVHVDVEARNIHVDGSLKIHAGGLFCMLNCGGVAVPFYKTDSDVVIIGNGSSGGMSFWFDVPSTLAACHPMFLLNGGKGFTVTDATPSED